MNSSPETQTWFRVKNAAEILSPALLVYPERVEENLRQMLRIAGPDRLRPHVKTHKMSAIVRRQMALGIRKYKCATLAETEMVAECGAPDVLLAMQPVGPAARRLAALARDRPQTHFSTLIDNPASLTGLAQAAREAKVTLSVFLDIDCGMHRTGLPASDAALDLYHLAARQAGLRAAGFHVYDGHIREPDPAQRAAQCDNAFAPVAALAKTLEQEGNPAPIIVAGGSPTFPIHAQRERVECSPGTVVFWDAGYQARFPDLPFLPAACVVCRVVSKPRQNLLCLDLGHKAVAAENPHPRVQFLNLPEVEALSQSEEHLLVQTPAAGSVPIGAEIYGLPLHICPTVALYDHALLIQDGRCAGRWPITARHRA